MSKLRFHLTMPGAVCLSLCLISGARAAEDMLKDDLHTPSRITIKIPKKVFKVNEPVNGTVVI